MVLYLSWIWRIHFHWVIANLNFIFFYWINAIFSSTIWSISFSTISWRLEILKAFASQIVFGGRWFFGDVKIEIAIIDLSFFVRWFCEIDLGILSYFFVFEVIIIKRWIFLFELYIWHCYFYFFILFFVSFCFEIQFIWV